MRQTNLLTSSRRRQIVITALLALAIFATSALLSKRSAIGQGFVDRITRPCATGGGRSLVQTTPTNVLINPCTGAQVTINGVPIIPGGGGDVFGPAGATDNAIARFNLATGKLIQNSLVIVDDSGNITAPGILTLNGAGSGAIDLSGSTSGTVTVTVAAVAGTWTMTLPTTDGNASEFLQTNGSGVTTWAAVPAGVTINPTTGTIPYKSGASAFGDSPFRRLSATHVDLFAGGAGGFDFDSSTPAITINGTGGNLLLGDPSGNESALQVDNASNAIFLDTNSNGDGGAFHLVTSGAQQEIDMYVPNVGATKYVEIRLDGLLTKSSLIADATRIDIFGLTSVVTVTAGLTSITGELQTPLTIRTGTASNTDVAGTLTVGGGGTVTYTFTQTYATAPVCTTSDTDAAPMIAGASATTTTLTLTGTVGHVLGYQCIGLN